MQAHLLLLLATGCAPLVQSSDVTVTVDDEITTLVHLSWESAIPAEAWVEYGPITGFTHVTPVLPESDTQAVTLVGVPADTTWWYRIVSRAGGSLAETEIQPFTTGALPEGLPALHLDGDEDVDGGYTAFSWWSVTSGDSMAAIVDGAGQVVWYWLPDDDHAQSARLSADNRAMLVLQTGLGADPDSQIVRVPLDGSPPVATPAPYAHHDFHELADGTIAYVAGETRVVDGLEIVGDAIVELRDGSSHTLWNAFEQWPLRENDGWGQSPVDWTHANGIGYNPDDDTWVLSLYRDRALIGVDRATGETAWQLGGDDSDFAFVDDDGFGPQHSPEWVDGEVLLFDNAYDSGSSRLVQYALDADAGTATITWSWEAPEGARTRLLGDVDRLEDGGALSAWGEREEILWLGEDGRVSRRLALDGDGLVGRIQAVRSLWPVGSVFPD